MHVHPSPRLTRYFGHILDEKEGKAHLCPYHSNQPLFMSSTQFISFAAQKLAYLLRFLNVGVIYGREVQRFTCYRLSYDKCMHLRNPYFYKGISVTPEGPYMPFCSPPHPFGSISCPILTLEESFSLFLTRLHVSVHLSFLLLSHIPFYDYIIHFLLS